MGGGGRYYDRDVTPRRRVDRTTGFSDVAEREMSRSRMDAACSPKDRRLTCEAENAVVLAFDVTGSMGILPKIIYDKVPMIAGHLTMYGILDSPHVSLAAIGDAECDQAPLQVGDFVPVKGLDAWLKRIWLEGMGGGNRHESYELMAWFYASRVDLTKTKKKILIITGDENFRDDLPQNRLRNMFGGNLTNDQAQRVWASLLEKFDGHVYLIHKRFHTDDAGIIKHWESVLGKGRVLRLESDKAVGDVTLGIIAMMLGGQTIDTFCESMKERRNLDTGKAEPQSPERIAEVRRTLEPLTTLGAYGGSDRPADSTTEADDGSGQRTSSKRKPGDPAKPGRKAKRPI